MLDIAIYFQYHEGGTEHPQFGQFAEAKAE